MLRQYLKNIFDISQRGDAREESYYSTLEALLSDYAASINRKNLKVTTLPKKTEAGNPDFRIWDGKSRITGYIEAKDPSKENLGDIEDTAQLKRYLHTFPNLILTNFYEFRLYRDGELIESVHIARPVIARKLKTAPPLEKEKEFLELLEKFFSFSLPKAFTAKTLAVELAKRTRFLREEVTLNELRKEEEKGGGSILGFYEAFKKYLIHDLEKEDFADLYSQTITYGLFAARTRSAGEFTRKSAFDLIPHTIGILREIFRFISLEELPEQMEWIVDDIAEILANADVNKILYAYSKEGKGKDPVVHFYETFLAEYDPRTRERRGVYYTPEPVVSYIVRSLDIILKEKFGKADGFATESVTVLDPAGGTLTFPAEAIRLAAETFTKKYGEGAKTRFLREHVLNNFYSFELMMAPYAIGHIKMGFLLDELGCRLGKEERFKSYLTNTLEMEEFEETRFPLMRALSEESHLAGKVKKDTPILVIMGNPPYSGHSTNIGEWITGLINGYKKVDGKPLGEKNPKWLQDDYVKFIRFAQWKIDKAGRGILGFITNHSWLDNPTFRGMRQSLMASFDEIHVVDLHGNSLKKEKCPDGSKDENVFDIQQGVAISIFVKKEKVKEEPIHPMFRSSPQRDIFTKKKIEEKPKKHECEVFHSTIWGIREKKYEWLKTRDIKNTKWKKLAPKSGLYLFVPRDERLSGVYEKYWKVTDIFPVNGVGMTTARDEFVIDMDKEALLNRVRLFKNSKFPDNELHTFFNINKKKGWSIRRAWNMLQDVPNSKLDELIQPVLYRPFDVQWIFYHDAIVWRTVKKVMRHMMRENLGLITVRQVAEGIFNHAYCTDAIVESRITLSNKGIAYLFPLYLYEEGNPSSPLSKSGERGDFKKGEKAAVMSLFEDASGYTIKKPNISPALIEELKKAYKKAPTPEEIFYYVYGVLYSTVYREKYREFLKTDFPRVPFTKNHKLFIKTGEYGKELIDIHLMKSKRLDKPSAKFEGKGDNRVRKPVYAGREKCVYINDTQFFDGISPEVFDCHIGGYRVMEKWLKDRKDKTMSLEDIKHYCRMATAIKETINLQKDTDRIYPEVEEGLL